MITGFVNPQLYFLFPTPCRDESRRDERCSNIFRNKESIPYIKHVRCFICLAAMPPKDSRNMALKEAKSTVLRFWCNIKILNISYR